MAVALQSAATFDARSAPSVPIPAVDFQGLEFEPTRSPDQDATEPVRHPVTVVGAGPVGLALAIDLAQRGVPVVLLDDDHRLSTGSRAICFAKRTLEIFDRLGCGDKVADKGVSWNVGKVFFRDAEIYRFDLAEDDFAAKSSQQRPAFVNLQQYYVEGFLTERARELPLIDLRWRHEVVGLEQRPDGSALLTIDTPEGPYRIFSTYVAACDGSRSALRRLLGERSTGQVFRDRFLIADVRMAQTGRPAERWFWFDPPFHRNQSVLLHMQPDNVWRIDFQLGWDADPEQEKKPESIIPRVRALLGDDVPFEIEWASVYTFACTRMASFRHGAVLFAGDAAHGVSPFGARGANSGIQDADNLGWKLAAVLSGQAPDALLGSYASEREAAADENIRHSTRSTDFITPKSDISRLFRDAVLDLARDHVFARRLVNSGRLSLPTELRDSPLNSVDVSSQVEGECIGVGPLVGFDCAIGPGCAAVDAPVDFTGGRPGVPTGWLLRELGPCFTLLVYRDDDCEQAAAAATVDEGSRPPLGAAALAAAARAEPPVGGLPLTVVELRPAGCAAPGEHCLVDRDGLVAQRYDLMPGSAYLFRPDQHVCARWRQPSLADVRQALRQALARADPESA